MAFKSFRMFIRISLYKIYSHVLRHCVEQQPGEEKTKDCNAAAQKESWKKNKIINHESKNKNYWTKEWWLKLYWKLIWGRNKLVHFGNENSFLSFDRGCRLNQFSKLGEQFEVSFFTEQKNGAILLEWVKWTKRLCVLRNVIFWNVTPLNFSLQMSIKAICKIHYNH